jgi:hypothetical protein
LHAGVIATLELTLGANVASTVAVDIATRSGPGEKVSVHVTFGIARLIEVATC